MLTLHTNRHAVHGGFTLKDDCERQVWNAGAASWTQRENHNRCSTWAINNHNLWAKYFTSLRHYIAEDLIVSCRTQWSEQLSCRWMSDGPDVPHVHERGTWQLCHVRRLAFPLNISFYLMQHSPLWRSKFRILRIKKTRTEIGTLRISYTSSKLHRDIPSGSFTKTDLRKIGAITDKVWWLSRAHKCSPGRGFTGFAFVCICILLSFHH